VSENPENSRVSAGCERCEDLEKRVDALETSQARTISEFVKPALDELREDRDDARDERVELRERLDALQQQLDAVYGLADDERSTPAKRAADLRLALIRRAQNSTGPNAGRASMYYREVQECFADLGHETVHRPECMRAMEDAAHADGFEIATKTSDHGNEVKAIRVDTDALPRGIACSDPTTRPTPGTGRDTMISPTNTSED
jgi:hypothetical protein